MLALWVLYVVLFGETRKAPASVVYAAKSSDAAKQVAPQITGWGMGDRVGVADDDGEGAHGRLRAGF